MIGNRLRCSGCSEVDLLSSLWILLKEYVVLIGSLDLRRHLDALLLLLHHFVLVRNARRHVSHLSDDHLLAVADKLTSGLFEPRVGPNLVMLLGPAEIDRAMLVTNCRLAGRQLRGRASG